MLTNRRVEAACFRLCPARWALFIIRAEVGPLGRTMRGTPGRTPGQGDPPQFLDSP